MTGSFPRGKTAISGLATFGVGEAPGFSAMEIAAAAGLAAVSDAGLSIEEFKERFVASHRDKAAAN